MVNFYVRRIKTGKTTYSKVPAKWAAGVKAAFKAEVVAGTITEEEYAEYVGEEYVADTTEE